MCCSPLIKIMISRLSKVGGLNVIIVLNCYLLQGELAHLVLFQNNSLPIEQYVNQSLIESTRSDSHYAKWKQ